MLRRRTNYFCPLPRRWHREYIFRLRTTKRSIRLRLREPTRCSSAPPLRFRISRTLTDNLVTENWKILGRQCEELLLFSTKSASSICDISTSTAGCIFGHVGERNAPSQLPTHRVVASVEMKRVKLRLARWLVLRFRVFRPCPQIPTPTSDYNSTVYSDTDYRYIRVFHFSIR